ncbi:hypothetical protein [Kushneria indalinina]|uniref:PI3K/PI4K catalytic domain-containing protein n=1 Tax=Kushneria indalinina DSM 14324 TaxID=1122140 RepID=A0A3D9DXQ4_9GAMM|nr:hypothetical protein [Kushneria indalinina]REC95562.1 hypothetical protein C8D72_0215 [Kushneria indalinina DSM 14324]
MTLNEGVLLAGMELSKLPSTWGIYKGDVEKSNGEIVSVYLKPALPPRLAFREFFAAFFAKLIDISTPDPYLVFIPEDYGLVIGKRNVSGSYCFAMEIKQYPDMSRNFSGEFFNNRAFSESFLRRGDVALMGIFDEILYNQDRHHENVLFDGENIFLIDHEYILDGDCGNSELGAKNWMWSIAKNASELSFKRVEKKVFELLRIKGYEKMPNVAYHNLWKQLLEVHNKLGVNKRNALKLDALIYCRRSRNVLSLTRRTHDSHKLNQLGFPV